MRHSKHTILTAALAFLAPLSVALFAQDSGTRNYIVKLRDEPVVRHMERIGVGKQRIGLDLPESAAYRVQLWNRHNQVAQTIRDLPQAAIVGEMDTVFNGLAVALRPEDVPLIERDPNVEAVIPSVEYHKSLDAALPLLRVPQAWASPKIGGEGRAGEGVRIAVVDTGIDVNHPMFQDGSLTPPGDFPRFTASAPGCVNNDRQYTNSKVIVARNYVPLLSRSDPNCDAQDRDGHGTFVASIAAGRRVSAPLASVSGVAPRAFLGSYKVFGTPGTNDSASLAAILKAIDDAVKDGMNVVNLSLGTVATSSSSTDPLEIAVANAAAAGVTVVVAAGNEGPATGTVDTPGTSPAAITVGSATNSRILANPLVIQSSSPLPPGLDRAGALLSNGPKPSSTGYSLVAAASIGGNAGACAAFPDGALTGKAVLIQRGSCGFAQKIQNAASAGAALAVVYNNQLNQPPVLMDVGGASSPIPSAMIGNADGATLSELLTATGGAFKAALLPEQTSISTTPNRMATFSSDGPTRDFIIKPDVVAPGTTIYAAAQRNFAAGEQFDASGFTLSSGTSFSTPMVAGIAALVKQANPSFGPAEIKSAIVNGAAGIATGSQGEPASPLAAGNGVADASAAVAASVVASPVSISFGILTRGNAALPQQSMTITNFGASRDTFTVTAIPGANSASAQLSVAPSQFTLDPGANTTITIAGVVPSSSGTVEGRLSIQSASTLTAITAPYWGTFLHPRMNDSGVVNAASFNAGPLSVAPGEIVSIFGSDLANAAESAATLPLPTTLGGATVTIGGRQAPLLYASPMQINAQVPFELEFRNTANVLVSLNGLTSTAVTIAIAPSAPGIFTTNQQGAGPGAVLHAASGAQVTPESPARPGEFLSIYATGLGGAVPSVATGSPASAPPPSATRANPTVTIGGVPATVSFSGLAPGFVGLYQVNIEVPAGVPSGDQPLIVTASGFSSNRVTLSVRP